MSLRIIPHLHKATHQVGLHLDRHKAALHASQAEAHILSFLSEADRCSIAELHRSFGHKRSTLTSILDRLEQRGLVERAINPDDRRSFLLVLTRAGKPAAERIRKHLERLEAAVIDQIGAKQVAALVAALEAIEQAADDE